MLSLPAELQQALCLPAELAINHVLRYDPVAQNSLRPLQGKLLALHIERVGSFYIRLLDNAITLSMHNDATSDAALIGTLSDFIELANASDKSSALMSSDIDLNGDTEFVIALTRIAQRLDVDWEALIAPATGSILAHSIGKGLRGLFKWGHTTAPVYKAAVKEYLEDEAKLITPEPLLAQFADEVDELKLATDRLAARIDRLLNAKED